MILKDLRIFIIKFLIGKQTTRQNLTDFRLINTIENKDDSHKNSHSINGDFFKRGMNGQRDLSMVIKVPSINQFLKKIEDNGGKIVKNKMEILDGYFAQFYDTEGNRIGL